MSDPLFPSDRSACVWLLACRSCNAVYSTLCCSSSLQSWHCMYAGICNMFERDLKERNSHQRELTYDVQQLFQWIDHLVSTHSLGTFCCFSDIVLHPFFLAALFREEKPDSLVFVQHDLSALV